MDLDRTLRSDMIISEKVYTTLCIMLGTPEQVAARRDVQDVKELVDAFIKKFIGLEYRSFCMKELCGSRKEGFDLNETGTDYRCWSNDHRVIWNISQAQFYNISRNLIFLSDSSESPPGFTLLWLPFEWGVKPTSLIFVRTNGTCYISSVKFRASNMTNVTRKNKYAKDVFGHAPCSSGRIGSVKYCFVSDFWPPSASSFKDRCHSWPPPRVVNDIVRGECHLVAKGSKHGVHADNEWRITFSEAEQKVVFSMNHTQFLTYGLLKLFLKEIINNELCEEEKLLSSYHMKTVIFWAIQQNTTFDWCPQNLLAGFWVCFKLLLKWVNVGVCPNFFIPENNMFLNSVHSVAQKNLYTRLYSLYEQGIQFLLHSPFMRPTFKILCSIKPSAGYLPISVDILKHFETTFDKSISDMLSFHCPLILNDVNNCMGYLHIVEQLVSTPMTQYKVAMLAKIASSIFCRLVFILRNISKDKSNNIQQYTTDKMCCYMLNLTAKFGSVSDTLYIAMYYYKTGRYSKALSVIEKTKVNLGKPCLMYGNHVNSERYREAVGGQSWSTKIRRAIAQDVILDNDICYISELALEQHCSLKNKIGDLSIPPFVMLHMLEFLCCRHVDSLRAQAALDDLQILVHHDQGVLVPRGFRDISWEILGICEQIAGNHQAALYSYQQSLRQFEMHEIRTATRHRLCNIYILTPELR